MALSTKSLCVIRFLIYSLLITYSGCLAKKCEKVSSCSCKTDSGSLVDLSPISNSDNTPYFADFVDRDKKNYSYSFNPCSSFTEGSCLNVAACSFTVSGAITQYVDIGDSGTSTFLYDNKDRLILQYTTANDATVKTNVVLICKQTEDNSIVAYAESDDSGSTDYYFEISTKYACVSDHVHVHLSVGYLILIAFAGTLVLYIVLGVIIQKFVKKESGKGVIPNYNLWLALAILIKDGFVFVVKRGKNVHYDKI